MLLLHVLKKDLLLEDVYLYSCGDNLCARVVGVSMSAPLLFAAARKQRAAKSAPLLFAFCTPHPPLTLPVSWHRVGRRDANKKMLLPLVASI